MSACGVRANASPVAAAHRENPPGGHVFPSEALNFWRAGERGVRGTGAREAGLQMQAELKDGAGEQGEGGSSPEAEGPLPGGPWSPRAASRLWAGCHRPWAAAGAGRPGPGDGGGGGGGGGRGERGCHAESSQPGRPRPDPHPGAQPCAAPPGKRPRAPGSASPAASRAGGGKGGRRAELPPPLRGRGGKGESLAEGV